MIAPSVTSDLLSVAQYRMSEISRFTRDDIWKLLCCIFPKYNNIGLHALIYRYN